MDNKREQVKAALNYQPSEEQYARAHASLVYYGLILIGIVSTWICSGIVASVFWSNVVMIFGAFFTISIAEFVRELTSAQLNEFKDFD